VNSYFTIFQPVPAYSDQSESEVEVVDSTNKNSFSAVYDEIRVRGGVSEVIIPFFSGSWRAVRRFLRYNKG
jgi:hypothetical protein